MNRLIFTLLILLSVSGGLRAAIRRPAVVGRDSVKERYSKLLNAYNKGERNYTELPWLVQIAISEHQTQVAYLIARDYIDHFLSHQNPDKILTQEHIKFIMTFNRKSSNNAFRVIYCHQKEVDGIMKMASIAQKYIDAIIAEEDVDPLLWKNGYPISETPDWGYIFAQVRKKCNRNTARGSVLHSKLKWFAFKTDTVQLIQNKIMETERYGPDTVGLGKAYFNNMIYSLIFLHGNNEQIKKGIQWMKKLLKSAPNDAGFIDTYANLLYKSCKIKSALKFEMKAVSIDPDNKEILLSYNKMKNGQPTW